MDSRLVPPIEAPVLDGLGEMSGSHDRGVGEVGEGAGDLEHAVEGAQGEAQALVGAVEQGLGRGVDRDVAPESGAVETGIGRSRRFRAVASYLKLAGTGDSSRDLGGGHPGALAQLR